MVSFSKTNCSVIRQCLLKNEHFDYEIILYLFANSGLRIVIPSHFQSNAVVSAVNRKNTVAEDKLRFFWEETGMTALRGEIRAGIGLTE